MGVVRTMFFFFNEHCVYREKMGIWNLHFFFRLIPGGVRNSVCSFRSLRVDAFIGVK